MILKVDIDFKDFKVIDELIERVYLIKYITGVEIELEKVYETNKGFHLYFETKNKLEDWEILFLQVILKDDYKRSLFNYVRVRNKVKNWNVLFKKKYKDNKVISEERQSLKSFIFMSKWRFKTSIGRIRRKVKRFLSDIKRIRGVD